VEGVRVQTKRKIARENARSLDVDVGLNERQVDVDEDFM
jgi:hypothetical protein